MENSPLAVWIIVAEACEGERRTVVLAVLVRVYEDIVVFHILNIICRGILVEDIIDAFRNQILQFAANHPVKTNKSCKCLDSSPAAFQYQFSDNTYGFSFRCLASTFPNILISHELTTKKEPRISARLKWNESCVSTIHSDSKPSSWRMSKTCYPSIQDDPD